MLAVGKQRERKPAKRNRKIQERNQSCLPCGHHLLPSNFAEQTTPEAVSFVVHRRLGTLGLLTLPRIRLVAFPRVCSYDVLCLLVVRLTCYGMNSLQVSFFMSL